MPFKIAAAAACITAVTSWPCHAQSAADAAALLTWGASPSKHYQLLKHSPSSVAYRWLVESNPTELTVVETSTCKFSISFRNSQQGGAYTGTLDYTAPQWSHLVTT